MGTNINNLISEDYLMHHGVKGQKWGVRKKRDLIGFRSNKSRSADVSIKKSNSKRLNNPKSQGMSPQTKQKIKAAAYIGGTVAAGVLAVYGSNKIIDQNIKMRSLETQQQLDRMRKQMNNTKYVGYTYSLY